MGTAESVLSKIDFDFNAGERLPAKCSQAGREFESITILDTIDWKYYMVKYSTLI